MFGLRIRHLIGGPNYIVEQRRYGSWRPIFVTFKRKGPR